MKLFIVPTDFSDISKNAALYATRLAATVNDSQVVLYNAFERIVGGDDGTPLHVDIETRMNISLAALENIKGELHSQVPGVNITCFAEQMDGSFPETLKAFVKRNGGHMIVMGITGNTRLAQIFMGSNTLNVVYEDICPVMIIPPDANYTGGIKNILYATDMKDVNKTTPLHSIKKVLDTYKANLFIVNIDTEHYVELTEENKAERAKLAEMFEGYNPQFTFLRLFDFTEAISMFAKDNKIDAIITVPRKHSFITSIFKSSHTEKLAYHSDVPIIAIHE
jgi:nucleotide-binding universal stress UspA family protein